MEAKTHVKDIEEKFHELTTRRDVSMVFITQSCAEPSYSRSRPGLAQAEAAGFRIWTRAPRPSCLRPKLPPRPPDHGGGAATPRVAPGR